MWIVRAWYGPAWQARCGEVWFVSTRHGTAGKVIGPDGREYLTAEQVREQLGGDITAELLRDWKRRGLITGHRVGRVNLYPVADVIEAELATRDRTRPRTKMAMANMQAQTPPHQLTLCGHGRKRPAL